MQPDPITTFSDSDLERMIDRAYREAVRSVQEVKAHCRQHGADYHDAACVMLGESAREADRFWHHLLSEQSRRRTGKPCCESPVVRRAKAAQLPAKVVA
jgi:hypothetical protein